jgi:excisionase family DNA binding protein
VAEGPALGFSLSDEALDAFADAVLERLLTKTNDNGSTGRSALDLLAKKVAERLPEPSPWYTVEAAARYLSLGRSTMKKLTAARALPVHTPIGEHASAAEGSRA